MGLPAVLLDASLFSAFQSKEDAVNALYWYLEAFVQANVAYLRANPQTPLFYDAAPSLTYVEDPPGREWWKGIPRVLETRVADCKSLGAYRCAECRVVDGEDAVNGPRGLARLLLTEYPVSPDRTTYHVTLVRGDDTEEDPSAVLGMGALVP